MPKEYGEAGLTTLETATALVIFSVALLTLYVGVVYGSRCNLASEMRKRAVIAAQAKLEELKSRPAERLLAEYRPGGAPGDLFAVPSIDTDRAVAEGQIVFFVSEKDNPDGEFLGLPRDLNGDDDMEDADVTGDFLLLPVRVTVRFRGPIGEQHVALRTILMKESP